MLDCKIVRESAGHVLLKFAEQAGAAGTVSKLNGRWFAGKQIAADTITEAEYEEMRLSAADGK